MLPKKLILHVCNDEMCNRAHELMLHITCAYNPYSNGHMELSNMSGHHSMISLNVNYQLADNLHEI